MFTRKWMIRISPSDPIKDVLVTTEYICWAYGSCLYIFWPGGKEQVVDLNLGNGHNIVAIAGEENYLCVASASKSVASRTLWHFQIEEDRGVTELKTETVKGHILGLTVGHGWLFICSTTDLTFNCRGRWLWTRIPVAVEADPRWNEICGPSLNNQHARVVVDDRDQLTIIIAGTGADSQRLEVWHLHPHSNQYQRVMLATGGNSKTDERHVVDINSTGEILLQRWPLEEPFKETVAVVNGLTGAYLGRTISQRGEPTEAYGCIFRPNKDTLLRFWSSWPLSQVAEHTTPKDKDAWRKIITDFKFTDDEINQVTAIECGPLGVVVAMEIFDDDPSTSSQELHLLEWTENPEPLASKGVQQYYGVSDCCLLAAPRASKVSCGLCEKIIKPATSMVKYHPKSTIRQYHQACFHRLNLKRAEPPRIQGFLGNLVGFTTSLDPLIGYRREDLTTFHDACMELCEQGERHGKVKRNNEAEGKVGGEGPRKRKRGRGRERTT